MGRMCRDAAWLNADGVLLEENRKAFLARKESLGPAVLTGPYSARRAAMASITALLVLPGMQMAR